MVRTNLLGHEDYYRQEKSEFMRNHVADFLSLLCQINLRKEVEIASGNEQVAGEDVLARYAVVMDVSEPYWKNHHREVC